MDAAVQCLIINEYKRRIQHGKEKENVSPNSEKLPSKGATTKASSQTYKNGSLSSRKPLSDCKCQNSNVNNYTLGQPEASSNGSKKTTSQRRSGASSTNRSNNTITSSAKRPNGSSTLNVNSDASYVKTNPTVPFSNLKSTSSTSTNRSATLNKEPNGSSIPISNSKNLFIRTTLNSLSTLIPKSSLTSNECAKKNIPCSSNEPSPSSGFIGNFLTSFANTLLGTNKSANSDSSNINKADDAFSNFVNNTIEDNIPSGSLHFFSNVVKSTPVSKDSTENLTVGSNCEALPVEDVVLTSSSNVSLTSTTNKSATGNSSNNCKTVCFQNDSTLILGSNVTSISSNTTPTYIGTNPNTALSVEDVVLTASSNYSLTSTTNKSVTGNLSNNCKPVCHSSNESSVFESETIRNFQNDSSLILGCNVASISSNIARTYIKTNPNYARKCPCVLKTNSFNQKNPGKKGPCASSTLIANDSWNQSMISPLPYEKDDIESDSVFESPNSFWDTFKTVKNNLSVTKPYKCNRNLAPTYNMTSRCDSINERSIFDGIPSLKNRTCKKQRFQSSAFLGVVNLDSNTNKVHPKLLYTTELMNDIIQNVTQKQKDNILRSDFLDRNAELHEFRSAVVNWLVKLHDHCAPGTNTFFMTVRLFDKILAYFNVPKSGYQIIAIATFWLSMKYDNNDFIPATDLLKLCNNQYRIGYLLIMEKKVLQFLKFDLSIDDPIIFVFYFIYIMQIQDSNTISICATYFLELLTLDYKCNCYPLSLQAASAVYLALKLFNYEDLYWFKVERFSGYHEVKDLFNVQELILQYVFLVDKEDFPYRESYIKYSSEKFGKISLIVSLKLADLLQVH